MQEGLSPHAGKYSLMRTIRVRNDNVPGRLGALATAIGNVDGNIGNIQTVRVGSHHVERDIVILVHDENHLQRVLDAVNGTKGVFLLEVRDDVLDLHRGGKIRMVSTRPLDSIERLRQVYTPGVADVCRKIYQDPALRNLYTSIPTTVAMVTDGTRVLGLGSMGPWASMPVMEGKAALLSETVGLSGVPILLKTTVPTEMIATIKSISPTFGGIHLEDIAAPRCFEVSERLSQELDIPVMHDDQDGTAVVALAAVIKTCSAAGVEPRKVVIGQVGLGAAGIGIAQLIQRYTGTPVIGTDTVEERMARLEKRGGRRASLDEIMAKADIVIATTGVRGLIKPEMVRPGQIVLALSNPQPEIEPEVAMAHGAAIAADGRSVNNLLAYPGIWRGALDSGASKITPGMLLAATMALVKYGKPGQTLPSPLDKGSHWAVARAVARAASDEGIAHKALDEDYFEPSSAKVGDGATR